MKAVYFKVCDDIDEYINSYLDKGWIVVSITPRIISKWENSGAASVTAGFLVIFQKI